MRTRDQQLALLAIVLAIAGAALLPSTFSWLAHTRERHAMLAMLSREPLRTPQPIVLPDAAFPGMPGAAVAMLAATLRDLAVREGALIEQDAALPPPAPGLIARRVIVSGGARAILRFVEAVELRSPAIRLSRYRLQVTSSGRALRLEIDPVMAVGR